MDLYLVPNNLENTHLVSANGITHYRIITLKSKGRGPGVTFIQHPERGSSKSPPESVVAEIEWKTKYTPTIIRSHLLSNGQTGACIRASHYLYKKHSFSPSRYFIGDDDFEYRWKMSKGSGCMVTRSNSTNTEIASSLNINSTEGVFAGERKEVLRIQPCSVDIDLIVLTFIIIERKRRERDGYLNDDVDHDEDPQGDGGSGDGGGDADADVGLVGEL